jgi:hypothetical protein
MISMIKNGGKFLNLAEKISKTSIAENIIYLFS